jgi:hypothetical protein
MKFKPNPDVVKRALEASRCNTSAQLAASSRGVTMNNQEIRDFVPIKNIASKRAMLLPIKVNSDGVFDSERAVSFTVCDKVYNLIVDREDIKDNRLLYVFVIAEAQYDFLVRLPSETFTTGSTITSTLLWVPKDMVEMC